MYFKEEQKDLFEIPKEFYLVHCISSDFALGAGIAKEINQRFNMRHILNNKYRVEEGKYRAILESGIFNLVTKDRYFHKPTYKSLRAALEDMKNQCIKLDINKLAMPKIGCGLDRLEWDKVRIIVKEVFEDLDNMEIIVCSI